LLLLVAIVWVAAGAAAQATNARRDDDADLKELFSYTLTMEKIQKLVNAQKDLDALQKNNPELAKNLKGEDPSKEDLDALTQAIAKYPQVVEVLKKDGLAPREYVVSSITLIQAGTAVGLKKAGTYKEYPPQLLKLVSQGNLAFVEQHWDEIAKTFPDSPPGDEKK
jgi:hypothetical protein